MGAAGMTTGTSTTVTGAQFGVEGPGVGGVGYGTSQMGTTSSATYGQTEYGGAQQTTTTTTTTTTTNVEGMDTGLASTLQPGYLPSAYDSSVQQNIPLEQQIV